MLGLGLFNGDHNLKYHYMTITIIMLWVIVLDRKTTIMVTIETKKLLDKAKRIFGGGLMMIRYVSY